MLPLRRQSARLARRFNLPLPAIALCLLLVALLFAAQTAHQHPFGEDSSHCQLCVMLHSAAPLAPCAVQILFVLLGLSAAIAKRDADLRPCLDRHNPRPPPFEL